MTFAFGSLSLPNIRLQKPSDSTEENSEAKKSGRPKKEKPLDPERVMKVRRVVFLLNLRILKSFYRKRRRRIKGLLKMKEIGK